VGNIWRTRGALKEVPDRVGTDDHWNASIGGRIGNFDYAPGTLVPVISVTKKSALDLLYHGLLVAHLPW
jgi:hypothetical protein